MDSARDLLDGEMDVVEEPSPSTYSRVHPRYKNRLMLSQELDPSDPPSDITTQWLVKACPKGTRLLLICAHGKTKGYTRRGYLFDTCFTSFPGGSPISPEGHAVLDVVYNKDTSIYYVMDVMVWDGVSMYGCDAEMRFFFARSKVQEWTRTRLDQRSIVYVEEFPVSETVVQQMSTRSDEVEGLIFFYRNGYYEPGVKSDVCLWSPINIKPN
jgi:hypothetical protein